MNRVTVMLLSVIFISLFIPDMVAYYFWAAGSLAITCLVYLICVRVRKTIARNRRRSYRYSLRNKQQ